MDKVNSTSYDFCTYQLTFTHQRWLISISLTLVPEAKWIFQTATVALINSFSLTPSAVRDYFGFFFSPEVAWTSETCFLTPHPFQTPTYIVCCSQKLVSLTSLEKGGGFWRIAVVKAPYGWAVSCDILQDIIEVECSWWRHSAQWAVDTVPWPQWHCCCCPALSCLPIHVSHSYSACLSTLVTLIPPVYPP